MDTKTFLLSRNDFVDTFFAPRFLFHPMIFMVKCAFESEWMRCEKLTVNLDGKQRCRENFSLLFNQHIFDLNEGRRRPFSFLDKIFVIDEKGVQVKLWK